MYSCAHVSGGALFDVFRHPLAEFQGFVRKTLFNVSWLGPPNSIQIVPFRLTLRTLRTIGAGGFLRTPIVRGEGDPLGNKRAAIAADRRDFRDSSVLALLRNS